MRKQRLREVYHLVLTDKATKSYGSEIQILVFELQV